MPSNWTKAWPKNGEQGTEEMINLCKNSENDSEESLLLKAIYQCKRCFAKNVTTMELIPIREYLDENKELMNIPDCSELVEMTVEFYEKVGYAPPWICYFVEDNGNIVGSAGIKGKPVNGSIEIAYGTMEKYQHQGIGTAICKLLVDLTLKTDPSVRITARTLPENKFSCRVLEKNNFTCVGVVDDPDDGEVLEWIYNYQPSLL